MHLAYTSILYEQQTTLILPSTVVGLYCILFLFYIWTCSFWDVIRGHRLWEI